MNCNCLLLILSLFSVKVLFYNSLEVEAIIDGINAPADHFTYQIAIKTIRNSTDKRDVICGGGIIDDNFILTSAHCFFDFSDTFQKYRYVIVAGTNNLKSLSGIEIEVDTVYVLKKYRRSDSNLNDIAILKLKNSLDLSKNTHLRKLNLPTTNSSYVNQFGYVTGFGLNWVKVEVNPYTDDEEQVDGDTDLLLKFASTRIISNRDCILNSTESVSVQQICSIKEPEVQGKRGGVCSGDSGSPVVFGDLVIGVISTGALRCEESEEPAIHARVSSFVDFIQNVMRGTLNNKIGVYDLEEICDLNDFSGHCVSNDAQSMESSEKSIVPKSFRRKREIPRRNCTQ